MAGADNLIGHGWKPGQSGNPKGRPKGIKNMSTLVQQILADETLMDQLSKNKPGYWDSLPGKNAGNAIIVAQIIKALSGNTQSAAWLIKTGYGDKLIHEFDEGLFQTTKLEVEIVKSKVKDERDSES